MGDVPDRPAYLEARWAEEQAAAKAASPGPWSSRHPEDPDLHMYGEYGWYVDGPSGSPEVDDSEQGKADADHIAYWDPSRVLADLTAKRAILAAYVEALAHRQRSGMVTAAYPGLLIAVDALAQVYAARPDFPEEFRD